MIQRCVEVPQNSRIIFLGDSHIGHPGFREDIFEDILGEIAKPNTYFISLGDLVEGRDPGHKFYDFNSPMDVGEQYAYVFEKLRPYVNKCLGMVIGNHEAYLVQKTTINPTAQFCADNGINYLGDVGRITVKVKGGKKFTLLCAHGAGNGTKIGSNLNKVADWAKGFSQIDCAVVGHYHKLACYADMSGYIDEEGLQRWKEIYIITNGAVLEGYANESVGSYVESKMLPPTALGYVELKFSNKGKGMTVELHPY